MRSPADWNASSVENLQRFGLKLFLEPDADVNVRVFIPVFHRWIQTHAVDGLLVDVADYTHLSDGPSVLLAGYEGNYAIDRSEGRVGLYFYRKQPTAGSLVERLVTTSRTLLTACDLLETDESVGGVCRFRGDEIQFVSNDRLLDPPTAETINALQPALTEFARTLFQEGASANIGVDGKQERLRITLHSASNKSVKSLLTHIQ